MATGFDETEFVDDDFQAAQKPALAAVSAAGPHRPPTREELDAKVTETQQRLLELKRAQEALERERASLEEARRRRTELHTGQEEMLQHLTRGLALLEEAEFNARRDAEQLAKTLADLRDAHLKLQGIREDTWTQENYNIELTRALTTIDNARMEWNAARLRWPVLSGPDTSNATAGAEADALSPFASLGFFHLCKLGLAMTWPLVLVALAALGILLALLLQR